MSVDIFFLKPLDGEKRHKALIEQIYSYLIY